MNTKRTLNSRIAFVALIIGVLVPSLIAETLYVDGINGNDSSAGTKDKPLKTISKAAAMVNDYNAPGPTTIKIAPGVYNLTKAVFFKNTRPYTKEKRLTIEATILPDDPNWKPKFMPVIISTEPPPKTVYEDYRYSAEKYTLGLKIEVSYVTIRGLKFLGNPAEHTWHYPIWREGDELTDLLVTQCMFVGDKHTVSYVSPICAKGHKIVVDHCIFYRCHTPIILWDAKGGISKGCAVRYCIIDGAYIAAMWTTQTAEDLEFRNNIITRSNYFWMRGKNNKNKYRLKDCIVTDCRYYSGYGNAYELFGQTGPEISYVEENVIKQGKVVLHQANEEFDIGKSLGKDWPRNYLHVKPGTFGSKLGSGLFKKKEN